MIFFVPHWIFGLIRFLVVAGSLLTDYHQKKQVTELSVTCFSIQRRGRDSNPRSLAAQRFSRPPQSTTLPPLQRTKVHHFSETTKYFLKYFYIFFLINRIIFCISGYYTTQYFKPNIQCCTTKTIFTLFSSF